MAVAALGALTLGAGCSNAATPADPAPTSESSGSSMPSPSSASPSPAEPGSTSASAERSPAAAPSSGRASTPAGGGTSATASSPAAPPATARTPGSTSSTVAPREQKVNKPTKKLTKVKSTVRPEVTAELTALRSQFVKSQSPGEISGDSIVFDLTITNNTAAAVDLGNVVVTVTGANEDPASEITSAPAKRLPGSVRPGRSARGTFVFTVPKKQRNPVTVNVTISADTSIAVFRGKAG